MAGTLKHPAGQIVIDDFIPDESPERDLMLRMINGDDSSIAQAIEELLPLTTAAAAQDFREKDSRDEKYASALWLHADKIASILVTFANCISHDKQSKLVDFVFRLQEATVTDPDRGGVLKLHEKSIFWTDVPQLSSNIADVWATQIGEDFGEVENRQFENMTAFVAQLSERGYLDALGWTLFQLTVMLENGYEISRREVRIVCIWFIYAPRTVWKDVQLRRKRNGGGINEFKPEFWPQWRQFLQSCQGLSTDGISDEDTQNLVKLALTNMDKTEAAENQATS